MDKKPTPSKLPQLPPRPISGHQVQSPQPAQLLPPLPSLDRSAPPVPVAQSVQLTGPQRLDSLEAKLAVQRSMVDSIIPVRLTDPFPCGVHPCINYTNQGTISYDISYGQYRISIICPSCAKHPRP